MSKNIGTLVSAPIRPNDSSDPIASAYGNEIKGGLHGYETISERDSIITARREWGMMVNVYNDGLDTGTYQLIYNHSTANIDDNNNWLKTNIADEWVDSVKSVIFIEPISPSIGDRHLLGLTSSTILSGLNWVSFLPTIIVEYDNDWEVTYPTNGMTVRADNNKNAIYRYEGSYPTGEWKTEKITQVFYIEPTSTSGVTYSVNTEPTFNQYSKDLIFLTKFNLANTGTASLNINGLGYKNIKISTTTGTRDVIVNDIVSNSIYSLTYDGTNFQMTKPFSSDAYNILYHIDVSETVTVKEDEQYWVYGDLTIEGSLVNYGKVIVANGTINLIGAGSISNLVAGEVILVDLFNTPTFNTSDTIQMSSEMTVNGPSVSSTIITNSITTDLLQGTGSATASFLLSTDGAGSFQWVSSGQSYKVYTALLYQTGTASPVPTVLENTLGTVTFTRTDVGRWLITSGSLFTIGKTTVTHQFGAGSNYIISVDANYDDSELYMEASNYNNSITDFQYTDDILTGGAYTHIEIKVYN